MKEMVNLIDIFVGKQHKMYYCLELLVEPWAAKYYKNEINRNNDNAGYDLYCEAAEVSGYSIPAVLVNQGVRARMVRVLGDEPYSQGHYLNATTKLPQEEVHYRLVPRSSICKTPLLMANCEGIIDRVYLYLNHDNTQDLATIEREVGRRQPHAIIYMDEPTLPYKYLNKELFEPLYCSSPAPIARMATLDVSLLDQFDNLVDLCGRDWTLLLEIIYYDQSP